MFPERSSVSEGNWNSHHNCCLLIECQIFSYKKTTNITITIQEEAKIEIFSLREETYDNVFLNNKCCVDKYWISMIASLGELQWMEWLRSEQVWEGILRWANTVGSNFIVTPTLMIASRAMQRIIVSPWKRLLLSVIFNNVKA